MRSTVVADRLSYRQNVRFREVPCIGEPRCPLVPKLTRWLGSSRSGRRSKYSLSKRATSTSMSLGAGLPASGEINTSFATTLGIVPPSKFRLGLSCN